MQSWISFNSLLIAFVAAKVAHGYVQVQGYFELQDEYEDYYTDEQIQIDGKWIYTVASNIPDGFEYYYSDERSLEYTSSHGRHLQSAEDGEVYGCKDFGLEDVDDAHEFASWLDFIFDSEYSIELIDDPNLPYGSQYDYQEENPIAYFNKANKDLTGPFKGRETMWIVDCISSEKIYFENKDYMEPLEVKGFFELQDYYEDYYTDEDVQINGEWIYIVASNIPYGFRYNVSYNESDNYYYDYYRKLQQEENERRKMLTLPYPTEEGIYGCKDFGLNDIDNGPAFVSWLNWVYHSNYTLETINDPTLPYGSQYDFKNEKESFNTANKGKLGPFTGNDGMWIVDCTSPEKRLFGKSAPKIERPPEDINTPIGAKSSGRNLQLSLPSIAIVSLVWVLIM